MYPSAHHLHNRKCLRAAYVHHFRIGDSSKKQSAKSRVGEEARGDPGKPLDRVARVKPTSPEVSASSSQQRMGILLPQRKFSFNIYDFVTDSPTLVILCVTRSFRRASSARLCLEYIS
ncbi:hypothetical protein EYF80_020427 [Liparis tanakae]|uniref:Uncharacterized protein n=1 Tax=Liparis tanakae TaxID=230148 RepID=A0A4Z2HTV3_9TELE|nr:hypothetical protein EYF80_020427 [Liparis tanakae]